MNNKITIFQDEKNSYFKSERLRKNLKASLEENKIEFNYNKFDDSSSICHFLYPYLKQDINLAKENNKKVLISLFYTEGEEKGRITNLTKIHDFSKLNISTLKLNDFYKADKILVPYKEYKDLLIRKGINERNIDILSPGVNYKIYKYLSETDMELARRYFNFNETDKIVLAFGLIEDKACIEKIYKLAKYRPDIKIVYLVTNILNVKSLNFKIRMFLDSKPSNVYFQNFLDINIYRSLLKNSRCLVYFNSYMIDEIQLLEAYASELQVFSLDGAISESLKHSNTLIHSDNIEDLFRLIKDFLDYKISSTISLAFDYVLKNDVKEIGIKLNEIYDELKKEKEND